MEEKRKPTHPGIILEEDYIVPLKLNLNKLAKHLSISRKTLHKIRTGKSSITVAVALNLAEAFDVTPQLWLNLQQKYDLWIERKEHRRICPIIKGGEKRARVSA